MGMPSFNPLSLTRFAQSLLFTSIFFLSGSAFSQTGGWTDVSFWPDQATTGYTDHGNGVIQLLDRNNTGQATGTAVHQMNAYNPTTDGAFSACFQTFFGCPGNDEIGADTKGDGMAFSFWDGNVGDYVMNGATSGGGLGYHGARPKMVTIEFDTYKAFGNPEHDVNYDATGINDQVAVHVDGNSNIQGYLTHSNPGNLEDGFEHEVCISYDPATGMLNASIDGVSVVNYDLGANGYALETYFDTQNLNITWSSGKFGATNPTTVTDGADISKNVGSLCDDPLADIEADRYEICEGEQVRLSAFGQDPTYEYEWFFNGGSMGPMTFADTFKIVTTGGNYSVLIDNGTGQATSEEITITVNQAPDLAVTDPAAVCEPNSVDITGTWVDNEGTTQGAGTVTYWEDAAATTDEITGQAGAIDASGTYYIRKDNNGCIDIEPVIVTINPTPDLSSTDPPAVCAPNTVDITGAWADDEADTDGQGAITFWTDAAATANPFAGDPTNVEAGTYYVRKDIDGCFDIATIVVTINNAPDLAVTDPVAVCEPNTVDITGTWVDNEGTTQGAGAITYWEDAAATTDEITGQAGAIDASGTYYIRKDNNGCVDIEPVNVTINPTPDLTITDPDPICAPQTVDITAAWVDNEAATQGAGTVTYWQDAGATQAFPGDPTLAGVTGTYYIQKENDGCTDIAPVVISSNGAPDLAVTDPDPVCAPNTVDITTSWVDNEPTTQGGGTVTYWADATATTDNIDATANAIDASGTYYIHKDNDGCAAIAPVNVVISGTPDLSTTNPPAICDGQSVDLTTVWTDDEATTQGAGTVTYWTDAAANTDNIDATATAIDEPGTYYIRKDNNGCVDIAEVTVIASPAPDLVVTNPAAVCDPETVDITTAWVDNEPTTDGNGIVSYWTDAAAVTDNIDATATAIDVSGTYYIKKDADGCVGIVSVDVTINPTPDLSSTDPAVVDAPATVDITGTWTDANIETNGVAATYWEDQAMTIAVADPARIENSGTYYINKTTVNGCTSTTPVNVVITQSIPNLQAQNYSGCEPLVVDLTTSWIDLNNSGGTMEYFSDIDLTTPVADPTAIDVTGVFYMQMTSPGGTDTAGVRVNVYPVPDMTATNPDPVCGPETVDITTTWTDNNPNSAGAGNITYWSDVDQTTAVADPAEITESGTYYILKTTDNGCFDVATVDVQVNPPITVVANPSTICEGQSTEITASGGSTYEWSPANGLNVTTGESVIATPDITSAYTVRGTDDNGCFADATVIIVVNPLPEVTSEDHVICEGNIEPLTVAGADSYVWSTAETAATINVQPLQTTTYSITGTDANQCSNTVDVVVEVNPLPELTTSGSTTICVGGTATLTADGADDYSWSPSTALIPTTGREVVASPANTTTYIVIGTTNGCSSNESITVTVNPLPIVNVSDNVAICIGESTVLEGLNSSTYEWSPADGLDMTTGKEVTASPTETTTYTVTGSTNGCPEQPTATVTVTVNPIPELNAEDATICNGTSVELEATGDEAIYTWSPANGLESTTGATVTASPRATTTYTIAAEDINGCTNNIDVTVDVNPIPVIKLTGDSLCEGETTTLQATGAETYVWTPLEGTLLNGGADLEVTPGATTSYTVVGTNEFGCTSEAYAEVVVIPQIIPQISDSAIICPGDRADLAAGGGNSYLWSTGEKSPLISVYPSETGMYYVTITNEKCVASDSVKVIVRSDELIAHIPNAFTPNNDRVNDVFTIVTDPDNDITEFQAYIFDRWGDVIYEWDNAQGFWDGESKNEMSKADVYNYMVNMKDQCNNEFKSMGRVTVVR